MNNVIEASHFNPERILCSTRKTPETAKSLHWIVLTRYFIPDWHAGTESERIAWLKERGELFEQYCLPSIINQRGLRRWFLILDLDYREHLPRSLQPYIDSGLVELLHATTHPELCVVVEEALSEYQKTIGEGDRMLCTRVDNDDALSLDHFSVCAHLVDSVKSKLDDHLLSFGHGAQYDARSDTPHIYVFSNNHFTSSLHTKTSHLKTNCLSINHSNLFRLRKVAQFLTRFPMWLEVLHGKNLKNRPIPTSKLSRESINRFLPSRKHGTQMQEKTHSQWRKTFLSAIENSEAMKPSIFAEGYATVCSRVNPGRIFEIGIHKGNSIKMWREILGSDGHIACMDLGEEACKAAEPYASKVYHGSQFDADLLARIGGEGWPFDIIIDDGSHQNPHMIFTLQHMFEYLRPGGAYIIEDIFTSYWPRYRGEYLSKTSLMEYLKNAIDGMFSDYSTAKYERQFKGKDIPAIPVNEIADLITDVSIIGSGIAVLYKKP